MDGVHDLGGREGFGPIVDKDDDKPFHADWEMRAFGIKEVVAANWAIDWFRHYRELVVPVDYLTRPYFDQRITAVAAQLIDEGHLTLDEIKAGASAFAPKLSRPPMTPEVARALVRRPTSFAVSVNTPQRFALGQTVRCRLDGAAGHTRLPHYARGRAGQIQAHHGGHVLADASARGEKRGEHLYTVGFASVDLWPEARGSRDRVFVDLWESYLEPA